MFKFVVESIEEGKKTLKFNSLKEAKQEYDKYLNYEKECISLSAILKNEEKE